MDKNSLAAAVALISQLALASPKVFAVPTTYALNYETKVAIASSQIARTPQGFPGRSVFQLDDGQSFRDNRFTIYLIPQDSPGKNPVYTDSKISATVFIDDPVTLSTTRALNFEGSILFGQSKWGQVVWSTLPQTFTEDYRVATPSGTKIESRTFSVDLSDELLFPGALGERPSNGAQYGATVRAIVTQVRSTPVVDFGSTAVLLALGVVSVVLFRRSRGTAFQQ